MDSSRFLFSTFFSFFFLTYLASATDVSHDGRAIKIDGKRRILISGSIHYPRSTPEMWPDLIQKAKDGGCDTIETYVFWNAHEPHKREYHFEGNLDLMRFLKEVQSAGLYAILRIGPYACAEWNYGGLPVWLHQIPGIEMRTDNKFFKDEMQNFTTLIVNMAKEEKLFAPQGGPIILTQIENEYGNIMGPYGEAGKSYVNWCAQMAVSQNVGVPWLMCQQSDAPQPMINTCNGFYCHDFKPNNPNSPKIWTENWTGWFKAWDKADPHRPAEDVAYAVARFYQSGGTLQNYYMYHGGTNFGRTSGGPYITTTYDYDAPLDEYGNIRQPKWGHLKELHAAIRMTENSLLYGEVTNTNLSNGLLATKYLANGTSACFLSNSNVTNDANVTFEGNTYLVPAWSVSVIPECKQEVFNTAKVHTQTSIMVKKPNMVKNEPEKLTWSWTLENMKNTLKGKGSSKKNQLVEQLLVTGDDSDYLWYMTSANFIKKEEMTLRVNTTGHILHAFVNGQLIGSHYAPNGGFMFVFEQSIHVKSGKNIISLLSATVGLKTYGSYFDTVPAGIVGGPVQLIGSDGVTHDLSANEWSYQTGLQGFDRELYLDSPHHGSKWNTGSLMTNKSFTWYKTTFKAPFGVDSVVLDVQGMGKGEAWVNGESLGRYWASSMATSGKCGSCDYRGWFDADQNPCRTGCGQPTQRWYHVPRSFLKPGIANTLVLFEEAGGDPSQVGLQTATTGTVCASVPEGKTMTLSCQKGHEFTDVQFASFGNPDSTCGMTKDGVLQTSTFQKGTCESPDALFVVKQICIGKTSCSIGVSENLLGKTDCGGEIGKKLAVVAVC